MFRPTSQDAKKRRGRDHVFDEKKYTPPPDPFSLLIARYSVEEGEMKQTGTIRIIKRREKAQAGVVAAESGARGADAPSERELRLVVSGWVR